MRANLAAQHAEPPAIDPPSSAARAVRYAREALGERDHRLAEAWLRRAERMVPADVTVQLLLASATMPTNPGEAVRVLRALSARLPLHREAGLGLCAALLRTGEAAEAARCLGDMLGRVVPPETEPFRATALAVCDAVGSPGWVMLDGHGTCHVNLASAASAAVVDVALDGRPACRIRVRAARSGSAELPAEWRHAGVLTACCAGLPLIGSGLAPAPFTVVDGFLAGGPGRTATGWARLPADSDSAPHLFLRQPDGSLLPVGVAAEPDGARVPAAEWQGPRWRFAFAASELAGLDAVEVVDTGERHIWGSRLLLDGERDAARRAAAGFATGGPAAPDRFRPLPASFLPAAVRRGVTNAGHPPCDVIVPIYYGRAELELCLATLDATLPRSSRLVLVNDGSPDPAIAARVRAAAGRRVSVIEHARPRGFPSAVNAGLAHLGRDPRRDVVILNSDTIPGPSWLERLSEVAHGDAAIGSCTPLTNDGTIVSYPAPGDPAPMPTPHELAMLGALCWEANGGAAVTIPTGVGFCMLMKGECLAETGAFRDDVFAQGYGEENDWCLRAAHLGWRHVAAPGVFVAHSGGRSFGGAKALLMERNAAVLERLHPGYASYVDAALAERPLLPARRRIDRLALLRRPGAGSVALVSHDAGGGVERHLVRRCAAIAAAGLRPIVLSPAGQGACELALGAGAEATRLPNLRFDLPGELGALAALLVDAKVGWVEFHHLLRHDPSVTTLPAVLGVPYDVTIHDYGHWCPRISLTGRGQRYCGEPLSPDECEECVADLGSRYGDGVTVRSLRAHSARLLGGARRVSVSCDDVAGRIRRQFPGVVPVITPWEDPATPDPASTGPSAPERDGVVHVAVVGAIGVEKGYEVLLGCARDAARRDLPLRFTIVGHTVGDDRLLATGRVFITGRFVEAEGLGLVRGVRATIGFVPSVCPETWCYALSLLWQAGLPVMGTALGAQGERIGRSGQGRPGWLLPLGLSSAKVNDALVSRGFETLQALSPPFATGSR